MALQAYQRAFIEFALASGALQFGRFVLKSGRISPYFFNSGAFNDGRSLTRLAGYYADAIMAGGIEYDMLFGAAYKGIPLVSAVAMTLSERLDRDLPYCFDRKEAKDHGEGGTTVGAALKGRVLVVDDVISAGTSARTGFALITATGAQPVGMVISLDRQERGQGRQSAVEEVRSALGLAVIPIAGLDTLIGYLEQAGQPPELLQQIRQYRDRYGTGP